MVTTEKAPEDQIRITEDMPMPHFLVHLPCPEGFNDFHPQMKTWPPKSGSVSRPIIPAKPQPAKPRDLGYELASALRARADIEQEKAEANTEFKARLERLQTQINMLQHDILTGQGQLPLETGST